MTDERNIAHDKTVAMDKKRHGEAVVENSSIVPQPGRKPPLIDEPRVQVDAPKPDEAVDANKT